jgi:Permuted papain-like amidase enzyme, YaeF/YiiX, C92 family
MRSSRFARGLGALALLSGALALPAPDRPVPEAPAHGALFAWNRDSLWRGLERRFAQARASGCVDSSASQRAVAELESMVARIDATRLTPDAPVLDSLEASWFSAAPGIAACGPLVSRYVRLHATMRDAVKRQSVRWDVNSVPARNRLYRALYGGRAAVEEVMLQQPGVVAPLIVAAGHVDTATAIPSAISNGVTLHSGDMLVSRGGFPTSALIARGNDYPGNFSHVALVHIDSGTHAISVIEAHIEAGVAISSADKYLADKKLRVLVVRPRADLPALRANPMLPHLAASAMLARAQREHIAYDFAMDYTDPTRLFCSEVASAAYRAQGVTLWMGISTISRTGLRHWLSSFGVEHFATQEPSDLEYDPQVQVVAEWHDPATLLNDHVDNAVTDAMLDGADRGDRLQFSWYTLPVARVLKAYSWLRVQFGGKGPVPEGMSASAALRNKRYGAEHAARATVLRAEAARYTTDHGYAPPYWTLVALANAPTSNAAP